MLESQFKRNPDDDFINKCKKLEHFVTQPWAVEAVLEKELLTKNVFDPCVGSGVIAEIACRQGYNVFSSDIHDWGYEKLNILNDFLEITESPFSKKEFTVVMNPPFSKAEDFVKKCFELGARKVLCYQRFSWYEGSYESGKKRGKFWEKYRPTRIWLCGERASCWRYDLYKSRDKESGNIYDYDGRKLSESSTAHAWFVWERGHLPVANCGHIFKSKN